MTTESGDDPTSGITLSIVPQQQLKEKRKYLKGRITRGITRIRKLLRDSGSDRRVQKEIQQLRTEYNEACETNAAMYEFVETEGKSRLDQWEEELTNEIFSIEEECEDYSQNEIQSREDIPLSRPRTPEAHDTTQATGDSNKIDAWIDELTEFEETRPYSVQNLSIADALYKLEASKDIPAVTLTKFDGNPLNYVEFIEKFKLQIHDKPHLSDNIRMMQLKGHLTGIAERALCGIGSHGSMYVTALKTIKEQFGQQSLIARAFINRLTYGNKINNRDKTALRDFSLDILSTITALKQIGYSADLNSSETLRKIIARLPNYMIDSWKVKVSDI